MLSFIKLTQDAVEPVELNGEVTLLSAEDGTVSYLQHYAFHTGIGISVPKGKVALLAETNSVGARGITVVGKLLTYNDMGEVRISVHNMSRTAFQVSKGMPIARLILLDAAGLTLEEVKDEQSKTALDQWNDEIKKRKEEAEKDEAEKAMNELHTAQIQNGPGKNKKVGVPKKDESNESSVHAAQNPTAPDGNKVAEANAAKNSPGGAPSGQQVPGANQAVRSPAQSGTPATV